MLSNQMESCGATALVPDTPRFPRSVIEVIRRLLSLSNRLPAKFVQAGLGKA
jgi:hypothetical protein